ncbi:MULTISPECIES: major capsid protein [unclassified Vibrio]|uniref:major capsid protein n=1 Tax=unclassified Vibrio TaxID=2614977 RepID=UPI001361B357|nr:MULTISPECIES: hypothetical protein [unclassified Vibrio]NAW60063.1 hypothetical protein [Vibrio sp. V36_P2S2PM302]NAX25980.1 hypothetical protein [Vibrio sp. V38_P2S17PM301]NAX30658.1 hypothetical protein [Vibrio sp. V37_P2S8PM304]
MSLKGNGLPNIIDVMNLVDPNGSPMQVATLLTEENPIIVDIPFFEANQAMSHVEVVQTALPNSEVRLFNRGVKISKGRTAKIEDGIAMFEQRSMIDEEIANLNGNKKSWRMNEDRGHLEIMAQDISDQIFYGNENSGEDNTSGLAARYGSLSGELGKYVIDAGGTTGKLTSIYVVVWGEQTVNARYPKGQGKQLLQMIDKGLQEVTDNDGRRMSVYETQYKSKIGVSVKDHRYVVRIANIPVDKLDKAGADVDLWDLLNSAEHIIKKVIPGKTYAYMNRTVAAYLDKQSLNKENVRLTQEKVDGTLLNKAREIMFRTCDSVLNTESRVV